LNLVGGQAFGFARAFITFVVLAHHHYSSTPLVLAASLLLPPRLLRAEQS